MGEGKGESAFNLLIAIAGRTSAPHIFNIPLSPGGQCLHASLSSQRHCSALAGPGAAQVTSLSEICAFRILVMRGIFPALCFFAFFDPGSY